MEIPKVVLVYLIKSTNKKFQEYKREQYLSIDDLIDITNELYDNQKKVRWLENIHEVREKISTSDKPWAYHYSLNMNWVLFFTLSYRKLRPYLNSEERKDIKPTITKVRLLRKIFDHVDGIVEDGDFVYLIKTDVNFIKLKLQKWNTI